MSKLNEQEKSSLIKEVQAVYGEKNYYQLTPEQKLYCERSESSFFKSLPEWRRGVTINQYIYLIQAMKEKPVQTKVSDDLVDEVRQAYLKKVQPDPVYDANGKTTIEVFVVGKVYYRVLWNWGKTEVITPYYYCLWGDDTLVVKTSQYLDLTIGRVCYITTKQIVCGGNYFTEPHGITEVKASYAIINACKTILPKDPKANYERAQDIDMIKEKPVAVDYNREVLL